MSVITCRQLTMQCPICILVDSISPQPVNPVPYLYVSYLMMLFNDSRAINGLQAACSDRGKKPGCCAVHLHIDGNYVFEEASVLQICHNSHNLCSLLTVAYQCTGSSVRSQVVIRSDFRFNSVICPHTCAYLVHAHWEAHV
jgi:hypothetical protein